MSAKIQHCRDNAHQAAKEALHYLGRYQVLKSEGIRRRDAASHAWKARALFRMAKGYEAQAEELEAEAAKQPDMFMAAIMADEVDAFEADQAEPFALCCGCGMSSPVSSLLVEGPNEYRCEPCTSVEVTDERKPERGFYRGKDWIALPAFDRFNKPMWQLKCRYAYDNAQEWEGGYTACYTLEDATKAAKRRIDGVMEREAAEHQAAPFQLEVQTEKVIVGKQLKMLEVDNDPKQLGLFA